MAGYDTRTAPRAGSDTVIFRDGSGPDTPARCRAVLDTVLRETVISRLCHAHAHRPRRNALAPTPPMEVDDAAIDALALALCHGSACDGDAAADRLIGDEGGLDGFFLDVAPRLADAVAAVAGGGIGAWRLQELIERLAPRFARSVAPRDHGHAVLLGTPELDRFGVHLQVAAHVLVREGWDAWPVAEDAAAMTAAVAREWCGLAVLAADATPVDAMAALVRALRQASVNPRLRVLVLSAPLARRPDRMARLGADAAAADLRQACVQAGRLLSLMPTRV